MPKKIVNNANIYFEIQGKGQPLILIGGFGCDHTVWTPLLERLVSNFKVLIFDNRGSGQTQDNNESFSLENLADDTFALANSLELENPHIMGHSMGGAIALCLGTKYSDKIGKLMVFNSSAKFNSISSQALGAIVKLQKANVDIDLIIESFMPWGFSDEFLSNPFNIKAYKKAVREYSYPQTVEGNERQLKALNAFDGRSFLNKITANTLVVGTERDLLVSEAEVKFIAEAIPKSTLKILPGSHVMLIEKPRIATEVILNFLKNSSSS